MITPHVALIELLSVSSLGIRHHGEGDANGLLIPSFTQSYHSKNIMNMKRADIAEMWESGAYTTVLQALESNYRSVRRKPQSLHTWVHIHGESSCADGRNCPLLCIDLDSAGCTISTP